MMFVSAGEGVDVGVGLGVGVGVGIGVGVGVGVGDGVGDGVGVRVGLGVGVACGESWEIPPQPTLMMSSKKNALMSQKGNGFGRNAEHLILLDSGFIAGVGCRSPCI